MKVYKLAKLIKGKDGRAQIKITFPFSKDEIDHVKTLPGRVYHGRQYPKYWTCPLCIKSVECLKYWEYCLGEELEGFLEKAKTTDEKALENIEIPELGGPLYPFQKKGVTFLETKKGRALIADEMGLGKTVQALTWLQMHPEKSPIVIVAPATLKLNWEREAHTWMSKPRTQVLFGKKGGAVALTGNIIIINYSILSNQYETYIDEDTGKKHEHALPFTGWVDYLIAIHPQVLIIDEIHFIKNNKARRTKSLKALGKTIPHIIGLSGTPLESRPVELYNGISLIDNTIVPNYWAYVQRYCGAKNNGFGWDFTGASNTQELHKKLTNSIMIRRLKADVLPELPDKIHSIIPIEIDNSKEYAQAEKDFITWVKKNKGGEAAEKASNAEAFAQIEALKQLTIKGKMTQAIEWLENFLDIEGKLVIFATHKNTIDVLMKKFRDKAVKVEGSVSGPARQAAVDRFQNDKTCQLFIGNIKAAGVGITLTAASNVAFLEYPWTPAELDQATDRCHRIGQKDSVNVYYLIANNTIDEKMIKLLDDKRKIVDSVLNGKEIEQKSLLATLINEYKEKNNMYHMQEANFKKQRDRLVQQGNQAKPIITAKQKKENKKK